MLLLLVATAGADTFWDIPREKAEALAAELHRGDVLLRWCPGCGGGAVVFRIGRDQVVPGTYSDGLQVQVTWKALAIGPAAEGGEGSEGRGFPSLPKEQEVFAAAPMCAAPPVCLADPEAACADRLAYVDVPYTWRLEPSGAWVWLGALVGLEPAGTFHTMPIAPNPAWVTAALACRPVKGGPPPAAAGGE